MVNEELRIDPHVIRRRIESWVETNSVPGASVTIVDRGETVYEVGVGDRRIDPDRPATPSTVFGIGSATKPVTATAILCLVDQGELSFQTPVRDYIPIFDDVPGDPVTVHQLLTHTSGFPQDDVATFILAREVLGLDIGPPIDGWETFERYVSSRFGTRLTDRERFLYYNSGYVILGHLVEVATQTTFADFVRNRVFRPLGMETATFDSSVLSDSTVEAMTPYIRDEDGIRPTEFIDNPVFKPPGGLLASSRDLAAFLSAHITESIPVELGLQRQMHEPATVAERLIGGEKRGYGYGWYTRPFGPDVFLSHSGDTGISSGFLGFLRERGLGISIACNATPNQSPNELAIDLLESLTGYEPSRPGDDLRTKVSAISGTYEDKNGVHSATVEWTDLDLEVNYENPLHVKTYHFTPRNLNQSNIRFDSVDKNGSFTTAEFLMRDGQEVELLLDRVLLRRTEQEPVSS